MIMVKRSRLPKIEFKPCTGRLVKPFSTGVDVRGDIALFIPDGTKMGNKDLLAGLRSDGQSVFFRLTDSKGVQLHTHGWIRYNPKTGLAEVTQYG
jgi:hypothetical protein